MKDPINSKDQKQREREIDEVLRVTRMAVSNTMMWFSILSPDWCDVVERRSRAYLNDNTSTPTPLNLAQPLLKPTLPLLAQSSWPWRGSITGGQRRQRLKIDLLARKEGKGEICDGAEVDTPRDKVLVICEGGFYYRTSWMSEACLYRGKISDITFTFHLYVFIIQSIVCVNGQSVGSNLSLKLLTAIIPKQKLSSSLVKSSLLWFI